MYQRVGVDKMKVYLDNNATTRLDDKVLRV